MFCRIIWSRAFYLRNMCMSALFIMVEPTIAFGALLFYLERFILIGALLFSGALLFFLQSAFLFLHSAFLILHSAPLKFPVWVSTCIFSLIVSQRAIYLFWYSYYFNSQVWSAYLLICGMRFLMILCVSIVILILYKTFRYWPHV